MKIARSNNSKFLKGRYFRFYEDSESLMSDSGLIHEVAYLLGRSGAYEKRRADAHKYISNYVSLFSGSAISENDQECLRGLFEIFNQGFDNRTRKIEKDLGMKFIQEAKADVRHFKSIDGKKSTPTVYVLDNEARDLMTMYDSFKIEHKLRTVRGVDNVVGLYARIKPNPSVSLNARVASEQILHIYGTSSEKDLDGMVLAHRVNMPGQTDGIARGLIPSSVSGSLALWEKYDIPHKVVRLGEDGDLGFYVASRKPSRRSLVSQKVNSLRVPTLESNVDEPKLDIQPNNRRRFNFVGLESLSGLLKSAASYLISLVA